MQLNNKGFSIIELIVSLSIINFILILVLTISLKINKTYESMLKKETVILSIDCLNNLYLNDDELFESFLNSNFINTDFLKYELEDYEIVLSDSMVKVYKEGIIYEQWQKK